MKNLKCSRPRDRLSELPESLKFHIFWLLPMRDVVRTTTLSKHWNNLWTTAPCLNFDYDGDDTSVNLDIFRDFVNQALISWEGIRIQKFKIDFHSMTSDLGYRDLDFWVYFALRKKVQELYLHSPCCTEEYSVPQNVFSCSSLKLLSLVNCYLEMNGNVFSCSSLKLLSLVNCCLEMNGNVQWNQLKSLTFDGAYMSQHVINKVLCGSPQLEVFILTLVDSFEHLSIRSNSLKRLSINHNVVDSDPWLGREFRIWTPNLETIEILGAQYQKYLLMDVSSLTQVTLGIYSPHHLVNESDLLEKTLRQIFPTIQHVEKLTLSNSCIKVLADMRKKSLLPSSSNVKFLILNNCLVEYEQIVGVLEIFPKLKMVVLNGDMKDHCHYVGESPEFFIDVNLPESFLLHLRTIEVTWGGADHMIFPFIEIVLKCASKLEKMVIRVAPPVRLSNVRLQPLNFLFLASQKLLRMPRSSPTAELIFCEY